MTATCFNGDCLGVMKTLPDKSVDLFVTDLPYGCLKSGGGLANRKAGSCYGICDWDTKIDLAEFWIQVKRLCKNDKTPIIMFCNMRFAIDLINSNPKWFRYDLVWSKNQGTNFFDANIKPMTSHELILVFSKKTPFYKRINHFVEGKQSYTCNGGKVRGGNTIGQGIVLTPIQQEEGMRCPTTVLNFDLKRDKRHPTAKSIDLLKWLIERYSNEGDTVLDPTAGSFNSGRAAVELARNYIGMEIDKDFFEKNKL